MLPRLIWAYCVWWLEETQHGGFVQVNEDGAIRGLNATWQVRSVNRD